VELLFHADTYANVIRPVAW